MNTLLFSRPEQINIAHLSGALSQPVADFTINPIGTGQVADAFRITLRYKNGAVSGPDSIVAKLPTTDEATRAIGQSGLYQREAGFYHELSPTLRGCVPECYYVALAEDGNFCLLLEDMAPAEQGDQLKGNSLQQAREVLSQAATQHAAFWNESGLQEKAWLMGSEAAKADAAGFKFDGNLYSLLWAGFSERFAPFMTDFQRDIGSALIPVFDRYMDGPQGPQCLVHGDLRCDNLLFGGNNQVTIVDWQTAGVGNPALDIAYYLGTSLPTDLRRQHEEALLEHYLHALGAEGVNDYSLDQLTSDYRYCAFSGFIMSVIAAMQVEQTERGDKMFMTMFNLPTELIADLDALAVLPQNS